MTTRISTHTSPPRDGASPRDKAHIGNAFDLILINARSICNKLDVLKVFLDHHRPGILAVTETWGRPALLDSFLTFDGYSLFRQDRLDRNGGGVILLVHHDLHPSSFAIPIQPEDTFKDSVWCTLSLCSSKRLLLGCLYRSPNSSVDNNQCLNNLFNTVCHESFDYLMIVGDFNCPDVNWEFLSCPTSSQFLVDCCADNYLTQLVSSPTRGQHILDLIFVNDSSFVSNIAVGENFPGSDHRSVSCSLLFDVCPRSLLELPPSEKHFSNYFDFVRADWMKYRSLLDQVQWSDVLKDFSVESVWRNIKSVILAAAKSSIPLRKVRSRFHGVPLSGEVRLAFRRRKSLFRSLRDSSSPLADKLRRDAEDDLRRAIATSRRTFERKIAMDRVSNPKRFWSYVRSSLAAKPKVGAVVGSDGKLTSNDLDSATNFNNFFSSVFTCEPTGAFPAVPSRTSLTLQDLDISVAEIVEIIRSLPRYSSPGPDGISNALLKEGPPSLLTAIATFFSIVLAGGTLPRDWKTANVVPIFKSGARSQCSNYRPVSLTCTLCKVFERLLKRRILDYLLSNHLLTDSQHGFLPRRSCCSALLCYLETVTSSVDDWHAVDALHLDLSKAFDRVPHSGLLMKLESYGLGGSVLKCLSSFLTGRRQRVQVGSTFSAFLPVTSGVPQGSVLGPLLFLLYVNDLHDTDIRSDVFMFADDIKLVMKVPLSDSSFSSLDVLQDDLLRVHRWCSTWLLKLNITKCACLHFGFDNPCRNYLLDDVLIKNVDSISDLGVIVAKNLKPSDQCLKACARARKMLAVIKLAFKFLDIITLTQLYKSYVRPLLEYCSIVWCPFYVKDIDLLENVQRRFTRILPDFREAPYKDRLVSYNLLSLYARRLLLDLTYVFKIIHGHIDVDANLFFSINTDTRTRGHEFKLKCKHSRLSIRQFWFSVRVVPVWNDLPSSCVRATSVASFKLLVLQHFKMIGII